MGSPPPPPVSLALFLFLFINHVATVFVCVFPDWKHSSWQVSAGLIGRVATFQGAWWNCFSPKWGLFVCDNYGKVPVYSAGKCIDDIEVSEVKFQLHMKQ